MYSHLRPFLRFTYKTHIFFFFFETESKLQSAGIEGKSLLGEIAFQLEKRILDYVFRDLHDCDITKVKARDRLLFGYTLSNIGEMINTVVRHTHFHRQGES